MQYKYAAKKVSEERKTSCSWSMVSSSPFYQAARYRGPWKGEGIGTLGERLWAVSSDHCTCSFLFIREMSTAWELDELKFPDEAPVEDHDLAKASCGTSTSYTCANGRRDLVGAFPGCCLQNFFTTINHQSAHSHHSLDSGAYLLVLAFSATCASRNPFQDRKHLRPHQQCKSKGSLPSTRFGLIRPSQLPNHSHHPPSPIVPDEAQHLHNYRHGDLRKISARKKSSLL